jgi:chemotaxis protein CheY-P-specific phosphatase CheC
MTKKSSATTSGEISSAARFALRQVGELLTRAFSQAVHQFLSSRLSQALPEIAVDDAAHDLASTLKESSVTGEPYLLIHCGFSNTAKDFEGKLAYLLSPSSQKKVLERLGELLVSTPN